MKTDLEIAYDADVKPIKEIAAKIGITEDDLVPYGKYIAKVPLPVLEKLKDKPKGKLVLVTAITATPAGEGKTVTSIGLIQGLSKIGKNVVGALREPSLGPTFGIKGGATGGGYAQVYPMWDIDLHFTGDIAAVAAAHNLLSAMVENHIAKGNELNIDPTQIVLKKTMDMNCRELRNIVVGLGGKGQGGIPHESGFLITSASEISAILALASDLDDLRERLGNIIVAYTFDGQPVKAKQLDCVGAMMIILKDAINPNLVQTLEGQPVFIHGFPFANIAHGANSIIATRAALALGDYVITEAGFAADLGAEKFMDIVCRQAGFAPDAVVLVASVRALMMHGGADLKDESTMNMDSLKKGFSNLDKHIANLQMYGCPVVVAINRFPTDKDEYLNCIAEHCKEVGADYAPSDVFCSGGDGGIELAKKVVETLDTKKANYKPLYGLDGTLKSKIEAVAKNIYGAANVEYSAKANKMLKILEDTGYGKLPVCIAKTQASISDDPKKKGAPTGWTLMVREINISGGAGFVVPVCGEMTLMPGLAKVPAAVRMDIDKNGRITGLK
ncbi:MAG: formate--tetrahydrofolate ligase [Candidatus Methanomethylophilaceae archaeon]|nr:formate--tetrahydrofolate ligase [Candidatus Methanomethylophilaceae archaeon]